VGTICVETITGRGLGVFMNPCKGHVFRFFFSCIKCRDRLEGACPSVLGCKYIFPNGYMTIVEIGQSVGRFFLDLHTGRDHAISL
jgi:hypothetical protein